MDYDQVLQEIGQFGFWQIWICFLASLSAMAAALITMQVCTLPEQSEGEV